MKISVRDGMSSDNIRVNGPVAAMLMDIESKDGFVDISEVGQAVLARDPKADLKPFTFVTDDGSRAYAVWIRTPDELPRISSGGQPSVLAERLRPHWNGALGMLLVANPQRDIVSIANVHGVHANTWSPYASPGSPAFHGLGGNMIFNAPHVHPADQAAVLGALGVSGPAADSPDTQAWVNFVGALTAVAGKATWMTVKYVLIDQTFAAMEVPSSQMGGGKAITLAPPEMKPLSLLMLGQAAKVLGAYISGPDEGNGMLQTPVNVRGQDIGFLPDVMALEAPFHMAGARNADPMITGLGARTSWATASGVWAGMTRFSDDVLENRQAGIFIQGAGGVGGELIPMSVAEGRNTVAVSDIRATSLLRAREMLESTSPHALYLFDEQGARELLRADELAAEVALAKSHGFEIVEGLPQTISRIQASGRQIDIFSPNAGAHPVTMEVADALKAANVKAVIGAANNVLGADEHGSTRPVGEYLLKEGIFTAHDSHANQGGAASVLFGAVGLTSADVPRMAAVIGDGVMEEYKHAFLKGYPPQFWRDEQAMRRWNAKLEEGIAVGGRFTIEEETESSSGPDGNGGYEDASLANEEGAGLGAEANDLRGERETYGAHAISSGSPAGSFGPRLTRRV